MRFTIRMCVIPAFVALLLSISQKFKYGWRFVLSGGTCVPSRMWDGLVRLFILRLECGKELLEG